MDPIAAIRSASLCPGKSTANSRGILQFLNQYKNGEFNDKEKQKLSVGDCIKLLGLEHMVDFLSNDFYHSAVVRWTEYGEKEIPAKVFELLLTERRRLRRVFYRWQIYFNLFGVDPPNSHNNSLNARSQAPMDGLFLMSFRSWEIEEITSVINYAFERYWTLIAEERYRKKSVSIKSVGRFDVTSWNKVTGSLSEYYLNRGPCFLHEFVSIATMDSQWYMHHLIARDSAYLEMLLNSSRKPQFAIWPREGDGSYAARGPDPDGMHFLGDEVQASPNAGWVMIQATDNWDYGKMINRARRMRGYAIWDQERIMQLVRYRVLQFS